MGDLGVYLARSPAGPLPGWHPRDIGGKVRQDTAVAGERADFGGRLDLIQKITLDVLARLEETPRHATEEIARAFKRGRELTSGEKAEILSRIHGILRSRRLLDYVLDESGPVPDSGSARLEARWFARELLDGRLTPSQAAAASPDVDWARVLEIERRIARIPDPARRLALTGSLPDWLAARLIAELGESEAFALAAAWSEPPPQTLRVNSLRLPREELAERFRGVGLEVRATEYAEDGLELVSKRNVFRSPEFHDGLFEVQDEGSQLISQLVAPPPGGLVLDACAGTGGKTLHLATLLRGKGRVVAVGVGAAGARQLEELARRAKRAGLHNVQPIAAVAEAADGAVGGRAAPGDGADVELYADPDTSADAALVGDAAVPAGAAPFPPPLEKLRGKVDRVLIDAPCSGIGVFRRNPEARDRVTEESVQRLSSVQREILERFAPFVKPGGRLIYATCSVLRAENDDVVAAFLAAHPEFVVMPAKEILGKAAAARIGDETCLRVFPHRQGADGFFGLVLRRTR
ncbi:MAG: RsmB/NOP family class I SAM-dependent RNA methyltransferase [Candidatus Eisenbacteria bacterium]